jgi:predicted ATP-grasp superfamily ATP-dependent carboligase
MVLGPSKQLFDPITGSYIGGQGPLDCDPDRLSRFAQNLLEAIPGKSAGWVGIDFLILPDQHWIPLEINARLTSSYLGYRMLYGPQLACGLLGDPIRLSARQAESKSNAFRFSVSDFRG